MDGDAYGGSGDLAGSMGEGSFGSAGGDYGYSSGVQEGMAPTSLADLAAAVQGMSLADKASVDLAGIGGREHSPGLSYADLAALEQAGFGKMDIPGFSQNVEQALAAQNVHNVLNYAVPALVNLVPGYGTVSALGKGIANIHGLMTGRLTAEQVLPGIAAGVIGAKTGIPSSILEGLFEGSLGKAAGAGAQAGLGAIASNIGPVGSLAYGLSGMGSAVNRGVTDAVSGAIGGRSGGISSLPGAGPAPSTSTSPTGSVHGDSGITQEISPTMAAIEQAVRETMTPAWDRQVVAGRYGPTVQYEYGA